MAGQSLIDQLNSLLPQTQCELCEYPGCRPYAEALTKREAPINRCLPGGIPVMRKIGALLGENTSAFEADMEEKHKKPTRVVIDESACIGCTKCLPVCPTDAIIGSGKRMHTIIADACTGCELCIPPCPMDCIQIIPSSPITPTQSQQWRQRHDARNARLKKEKEEKQKKYDKGKEERLISVEKKQQAIADVLARLAKNKLPETDA